MTGGKINDQALVLGAILEGVLGDCVRPKGNNRVNIFAPNGPEGLVINEDLGEKKKGGKNIRRYMIEVRSQAGRCGIGGGAVS